jgi:hypothetical protein
MLALRSLVYTIIIPGTVTVLIPYLILSGRGERIAQPWGVLQVLGLVGMAVGVTILPRCIWEFMATGRGTLAPIDRPKELVVRRLTEETGWVAPMSLGSRSTGVFAPAPDGF